MSGVVAAAHVVDVQQLVPLVAVLGNRGDRRAVLGGDGRRGDGAERTECEQRGEGLAHEWVPLFGEDGSRPPPGDRDRLLVVEDVVTTGGSTVKALEALEAEGRTVVGVLTVLDRLAGGAATIEAKAGVPLTSLVTIDEIYRG